jgi:uncharacterized protein YcbK (DUF882 family)
MRNFKITEFACKCCGEVHMEDSFLDMIDAARDIAGVPFKINSGYRCPTHNAAIGSTSENHPAGRAADISATESVTRMKILRGLVMAGFNRIGVHKQFLHADNMDKIGSPLVCWFY